MRKSIAALIGLMGLLSACGTPGTPLAAAPAAQMAAAGTGNPDLDLAMKLFDKLEAFYQTKSPSVMSLSERTYGPGFGFATIAPKNTDASMTEVNVGTITKAGKITTLLTFASRLNRARNPQLDEATAAIKAHIAKHLGPQIKQLVISTNPAGHDKFSYLAIGSRADRPDMTFFHAGTYAVGGKQITSIMDFGTNIIKK